MSNTTPIQNDVPEMVFVRSLGHSGSTLLGQLICNEFNYLSLGEVCIFFKHYDKGQLNSTRHCSCGTTFPTCEYWSEVLEGYKSEITLKEKFFRAITIAHKKYQKPIVEIGKNDDAYKILQELSKEGKVKLTVVYLFRDARGWVNSYLIKTKNNSFFHTVKLFKTWYIQNKRIYKEMKEQETPHVTTYEKILFTRYTGLEFEHLEKNKTLPVHHITTGNLKSVGTEGNLRYDYRWLANRSLEFIYTLLPMVHSLNHTLIYKELLEVYKRSIKKVEL